MTTQLNQELEAVPEPIAVTCSAAKGLLNSNYKSIAKHNYSMPNTATVFGIRQRIKSSHFNRINYTPAVLKVSVFVMALIAIF